MGQSCSTSKSKSKSKSRIKHEIPHKQTAAYPSEILVTKKAFVYPKCLHFHLINVKANLDTGSVGIWQKNSQRAQRMKYVEINPRANEDYYLQPLRTMQAQDFALDEYGFLTFMKNPSASKYLRQASFFFEKTDRDDHMNQLVDLFKYPRSINNLTLSFFNHRMINDGAFIHICEGLKKFALLNTLALDLSNCQLLTDKSVDKLARSLKRCFALERLGIDLSYSGRLTDASINSLGRSIRRLKKLKSLFLKTGGNSLRTRVIDENFMDLWKTLREKKELKELQIYFDQCSYFSNEEFEKMSQILKGLEGLQRLTLSFENCGRLGTSRALGSLGSIIKQMKNLTDLQVMLAACRNDGEGKGLEDFLLILQQQLPILKNVRIELKKQTSTPSWTIEEYEGFESPRFYFSSHPEVTRKEMESLANLLTKNSRFIRVVLDFEGCKKASDMRLDLLTEAIKENPTFKHIAFDFSDCWEVTDQKLIEFGNHLNHKLLESLKLRFYAAGQVRSDGIEGLSKAISQMSCLKALRLDFDWCWKLSDEAVESLAESVKGLLTLKSLRLNFSNCGGFSDESFAKLQESLQGLISLENLTLSFKKNENMTNKGLIYIADSLQNLRGLRIIDLNFFWCTNLTQKGLDYFLDQLETWQGGKKVFLNFNMCPQIQKERLDKLKTSPVFSRMETSR